MQYGVCMKETTNKQKSWKSVHAVLLNLFFRVPLQSRRLMKVICRKHSTQGPFFKRLQRSSACLSAIQRCMYTRYNLYLHFANWICRKYFACQPKLTEIAFDVFFSGVFNSLIRLKTKRTNICHVIFAASFIRHHSEKNMALVCAVGFFGSH